MRSIADSWRRVTISGSPPLEPYRWPVSFNVADSAISIGAVLVLVELLLAAAADPIR